MSAVPDRARPRAVHLTSVHRPFDSRIFHKECRTLLAAGFDVVLVAPHDREETVDGVHVVPIAKAGRRLARFWRSGRDVLRRATELDGDVYHFHDPELIPVGLVLRLRGKRVIYDVHEDLPRDVLDKAWIPGPLRWLTARAAAAAWRPLRLGVHAVVSANREYRTPLPRAETVLVRNFPIVGELSLDGARPYAGRPYDAIYVGGHHRFSWRPRDGSRYRAAAPMNSGPCWCLWVRSSRKRFAKSSPALGDGST